MSDQVFNRENDQVYAHINETLAVIQRNDLSLTDWANPTLRCGKDSVIKSMDQIFQPKYPSDRSVSRYE